MEKRSKSSQRLKIDRQILAEVEQAEKEQLHAALFLPALLFSAVTQQPPAKAGGLGLRTESPDTRRLNDAS
jgi:hypothetical protein